MGIPTVKKPNRGPKFKLYEVVYSRPSAIRGYLEPLVIGDVAYDHIANTYSYRWIRNKRLAELIIKGKLSQSTIAPPSDRELSPVNIPEHELIYLCEQDDEGNFIGAMHIYINYLERELASAQNDFDSVNCTESSEYVETRIYQAFYATRDYINQIFDLFSNDLTTGYSVQENSDGDILWTSSSDNLDSFLDTFIDVTGVTFVSGEDADYVYDDEGYKLEIYVIGDEMQVILQPKSRVITTNVPETNYEYNDSISAPKWGINEFVYLKETAETVGRLERLRVDRAIYNRESGEWEYTFFFKQRPGESMTVGDRIDLKENVIFKKAESELVGICDALELRVDYLTKSLDSANRKAQNLCQSGT